MKKINIAEINFLKLLAIEITIYVLLIVFLPVAAIPATAIGMSGIFGLFIFIIGAWILVSCDNNYNIRTPLGLGYALFAGIASASIAISYQDQSSLIYLIGNLMLLKIAVFSWQIIQYQKHQHLQKYPNEI